MRLDGVAYGFALWVNGKSIGTSSASAFNANTFDITGSLQTDATADNVLAVQVTTKPFGYEFDLNDDWSLSGIYRDVTLFSVPAIHVQGVAITTAIEPDQSAKVSVTVDVNDPAGKVIGKLIAPGGETVIEFEVPRGTDGHYSATVNVAHPQLWSAETPALYHVQLALSSAGVPLQNIDERIGLREVSIVDGVLLLNGRPIKLRGVNHHDIDPVSGRAITEQQMRRDLELMRKGNVNFIRTSHYAPQPKFIELCDELGFYVMCEVAIGFGDKHDNDPAYRQNIMARTEATIARDRNRPSVIVWSIGNENPVTDILLDAGRLAKQINPSRPICYPAVGGYFAGNYQKYPAFVDIYAPHYPTTSMLNDWAKTLDRPTILTEYAHSLGLAADRIQDQWDILQKNPRFAGGAIWHFMDQGLLRTSAIPIDVSKRLTAVWLDKGHYYDTHGDEGMDGVVFSDRTPQPDFYEMRRVYSPVQILERTAAVIAGAQNIKISIENRHDFRSLSGMKLAWSLLRNGVAVQQGNSPLHALAHDREVLEVPVDIASDATGDVMTLNLRCIDETNLQITEQAIRLNVAGGDRNALLKQMPEGSSLKIVETKTAVTVEHSNWVLSADRTTGDVSISDRNRRLLVSGIYPHPGRKLTLAETLSAKAGNTWRESTLIQVASPSITLSESDGKVLLSVSGRYTRPEAPDESFVGGYHAEMLPSGVINIAYDYVPTSAKGRLSEAGLAVVLPQELTQFRWIGEGPFAGYPGKDRLNDYGVYHLDRGDIRFQGNRQRTELALLTAGDGFGIALSTAAANCAVERSGNQTLLSHNAVIGGLGNKNLPPETTIDAPSVGHIAGHFTLIPLATAWPATLTRWFGPASGTCEIFAPFFASYDQ